ncbi:MAG: RluA family pseudouridine synthase [Paracoccaceae bacterium]|jgi:tRNA pseudouridine32 synthase/23S rRNA pseudouridine746 synthase|nr:RluA family pseudouridine synthase [Paracoccaceae bacterium]
MKPPPLVYTPPDTPLTVLHEDTHCLVLDKPAGLLAVPGKTPGLADCLEARARARWPDALTVHRLDLATSGVCVLARGAAAHRHLSMQFARRHVAKRYTALVHGAVWAATGAIDLPMRADWPHRPRQMIDPAQGRPALTRWRITARHGASTRLALEPLTGRSHQLRLHLLALGHPILGDLIYGGGTAEAPRLMLHAAALTFRHPADGRPVTVSAPDPF